MSESPLHFQLQQERIKICNSKPNSFFKKLFKGYWRRPAFLKNQSGKLPEPSNSPRNWKKWKTYQNRTLPKKEFFGGKWREYGRNKRKYDRLGKSLQERNTILWDFPSGEIILGVLEIPCTPQKSKWAAASWKKTINTECFPFRTHSHRVFFGRKWRECERNVGKYEKNGNM